MMTEPFYDAEEAIMWVYRSSRDKGFYHLSGKVKRPCETSDIVVIAKRLKAEGKITAGQYLIFDKFVKGEIQGIPSGLFDKWNDFVSKMNEALVLKNIVVKGVA